MRRNPKRILVTGGLGFIGMHLIEVLLNDPRNFYVVNVDKQNYAANVADFSSHDCYRFYSLDLCETDKLSWLIEYEKIDLIFHLAAQTHVDRSFDYPFEFVQENIVATLSLLEAIKDCPAVHLHHVSTDEVFGATLEKIKENSLYYPSSVYSATKASAEMLVHAYEKSFGLSATISYCSNNFGPYQHVEKFIPKIIQNALEEKEIPIYGKGEEKRNWLYVKDHVQGLMQIAFEAPKGSRYNISSKEKISNLDLAKMILEKLSQKCEKSFMHLLQFVPNRKGHDFTYSLDTEKIEKELNWFPQTVFEEALDATINEYFDLFKGKTLIDQLPIGSSSAN